MISSSSDSSTSDELSYSSSFRGAGALNSLVLKSMKNAFFMPIANEGLP